MKKVRSGHFQPKILKHPLDFGSNEYEKSKNIYFLFSEKKNCKSTALVVILHASPQVSRKSTRI